LVHASTVATWVDFLESVGGDAEAGMARARLPLEDYGSSDAYVPCRSLCSWAANEGRAQGLDNIGLRVADRAGVDGLPPGILATVARSETLHDGLKAFCEEVARASSHVKIWLVERPEAVYVCHRGSFGREVEGQIELTWWTLGTLIHLVRMFLGNDWQPSMIGVPSQGNGRGFASALLPRVRFVAEPERAWIAIPRRHLGATLKTLRRFPEGAESPEAPRGFVASLRYALRNFLSDGHPNIELAAEIAGTSVRTLQRRLKASGHTYSEIVDEAKFLVARELLLDPTAKVIDVAYDTGYTDPSHFSRAFRRMSGVSPREYRLAAWGTAAKNSRRDRSLRRSA
jgi:AraC-like DNA-binding protein